MSYDFNSLSDRGKYSSERRSGLLSKFIKEDRNLYWIYDYEVDVEKYLKRKLGFSEWDSKWDVGLHLKGEDIYLMLSNKDEKGNFRELEKVKYYADLDAAGWIMDCLVMHRAYKR